MPDLRERLQQSLGSAYTLERELGGGSMARVFLAEERALGREVVVKVLAPEIAGELSLERFRREVQIAARLQHPHIIPILSTGESDGLPFYTMPYVEGESLRARLAREGALSLRTALRIMREIADALAYAHAHGVVHRDVKPDNVLMSGAHSLVTDFGIAKAVSASRTRDREILTRPGTSLGTPAYMAPEQAVGDPAADHRADVYSFGCVAYELLGGAPPFAHRPVHELLRAHLNQRPASIAQKRPDIPPALDSLVQRCLEKDPAHRPQSAQAIVEALDALAKEAEYGASPAGAMSAHVRWRAVAALALIATAGVIAWWATRTPSALLDPDLVEVIPFRVSGSDPSLRYLREGMLDLLEAKFIGSARVVDPRSALAAWRRAGGSDTSDIDEASALQLARHFGAGELVLGSVTGSARLAIITATLADVRTHARHQGEVQGPPDSIPTLIDQLVTQLLAARAGQDVRNLASLGSVSMTTLREYLAGQWLSRRGKFEGAIPHYRAAITSDSTFALAGMGLALSIGWLDATDPNEGWRVAWRGRDRLSSADRAILEAWVGPAYPAPPTRAEILERAERATQIAADKPEAWYALGDHLYHDGALLGIENAPERSLAAFNRAVALDSNYGNGLEHLPDLYLRLGDTTSARRSMELNLSLDSTSLFGTYELWYAGAMFGNRERHDRAVSAIAQSTSVSIITNIAQSALITGVGYDDAQQLFASVAKHGATDRDRWLAGMWLYQLASARGEPALAARLFNASWPVPAFPLFAALFEGGDSATAALARRNVMWMLAPDSAISRCPGVLLAAEYDLLARGDTSTAASEASAIESRLAAAQGPTSHECSVAAMTLRVLLAARDHAPKLSVLAARLDSALRVAPIQPWLTLMSGNLIVARAWEQLGDMRRALAAVRRRPILVGTLLGWSALLREEGRLASLTGDKNGAIRAYRLFVALRGEGELSQQADVEGARAEIAKRSVTLLR